MLDPVKIPQNIYVEDRIIGPVSLRQLMIIMIGGGISYMIWSMLKASNGGQAGVIMTTLSWSPAAIAAAFAFVKIHHCSLLKLCLLFIEKFDKPNLRIWTPRRGIILDIQSYFNIRSSANALAKKQKKYSQEVSERKQIGELSNILDTGTQYNQLIPTEPKPKEKEQVSAKAKPEAPVAKSTEQSTETPAAPVAVAQQPNANLTTPTNANGQ